MGGKSAPKRPTPPDPYQVALGQQIAGAVGETTPFGTVSYSTQQIPGQGGQSYSQLQRNVQLSPEQQALLTQRQGLQKGLLGLGERALSYDAPDFSEDRRRIEDTLYGAHTRFLDPQFQQREEDVRTRLINQGLTEGSEGQSRALQELQRARESAYGGAREQSILAGGQEQSRLLADLLRSRAAPINEILSSLSGAQVQLPEYQATQAPDLAGNIYANYQAQLADYQNQLQNRSSRMGATAGLLGSLLTAPMTGGTSLIGYGAGRLLGA